MVAGQSSHSCTISPGDLTHDRGAWPEVQVATLRAKHLMRSRGIVLLIFEDRSVRLDTAGGIMLPCGERPLHDVDADG